LKEIVGALVGDRQDAVLLAHDIAAAARQQGEIVVDALLGDGGARLAAELQEFEGWIPRLAVDARQNTDVFEILAIVLEGDPLHRVLPQGVADGVLAAHLAREGIGDRRHAVSGTHGRHRFLAPQAGGALRRTLMVTDADSVARGGAAYEAQGRGGLCAETFVADILDQVALEADERTLRLDRE